MHVNAIESHRQLHTIHHSKYSSKTCNYYYIVILNIQGLSQHYVGIIYKMIPVSLLDSIVDFACRSYF